MKVIHLNEKEAVMLATLAARQDLSTSTSGELAFYRYYFSEICRCFGLDYEEKFGTFTKL